MREVPEPGPQHLSFIKRRGRLRWVERGWPTVRHARRTETEKH